MVCIGVSLMMVVGCYGRHLVRHGVGEAIAIVKANKMVVLLVTKGTFLPLSVKTRFY